MIKSFNEYLLEVNKSQLNQIDDIKTKLLGYGLSEDDADLEINLNKSEIHNFIKSGVTTDDIIKKLNLAESILENLKPQAIKFMNIMSNGKERIKSLFLHFDNNTMKKMDDHNKICGFLGIEKHCVDSIDSFVQEVEKKYPTVEIYRLDK